MGEAPGIRGFAYKTTVRVLEYPKHAPLFILANTLDIDVRDLLGLFLGKDKGRIKNTSDHNPISTPN